ncbi:MAG: barstar family protein [Caldilineaceae bacterium]
MSKKDESLAVPAGLYRVAGLSGAELLGEARTRGWQTAHLNATNVGDKAGFLRLAQRALNLPTYFGHNWDAFEEVLRDLPPAPGYLLYLEEPSHFARNRPHDWAKALALLTDVAEFYSQRGTPFYVLLGRTRGAAPHLPLLD